MCSDLYNTADWVFKSGEPLKSIDEISNMRRWGADVNTNVRTDFDEYVGMPPTYKARNWFDMFEAGQLGKYDVVVYHTVMAKMEDVEVRLEIECDDCAFDSCVFDVKLDVKVFSYPQNADPIIRCERNVQFEYSRSTDSMRWLEQGLALQLTRSAMSSMASMSSMTSDSSDASDASSQSSSYDDVPHMLHMLHKALDTDDDADKYDVVVPLEVILLG
jgi:hypothetical protein